MMNAFDVAKKIVYLIRKSAFFSGSAKYFADAS